MNRTTDPRRRAIPAMVAAIVAATAMALVTDVSAIDVEGSLRVGRGFGATPGSSEASRQDYYWDEWNGFLDPHDRSFDPQRDLAVVLTGEGPEAEDQPGFRIANGGLWPATLVARAGSTLEIRNTDPVAHELTATGFGEFSPTPTSPGLTRRVTLGEAGNWPIVDVRYDHVRGHLHVLSDLVARATIDSDGRYHFSNVPAGTYTVKVFFRGELVGSRDGVVVDEHSSRGRGPSGVTVDPIPLRGS